MRQIVANYIYIPYAQPRLNRRAASRCSALHTSVQKKARILKAFDFKALPVDVVMVECSYRAEQLQGLMDQKGFLRQARAHGDYVFLSRRATGVCGAPAPTRGGRPPGVARTYTRPEPKEVEEIDF